MDVELSRHLMAQRNHARLTAEDLELMGKEASTLLLTKGVPLNESIAKMAASHHGFNAEQVKRVVEFANTSAYLAIHDTTIAPVTTGALPMQDESMLGNDVEKFPERAAQAGHVTSKLASARPRVRGDNRCPTARRK